MGSKVEVPGGCMAVALPSYYRVVSCARKIRNEVRTMALAHSFIINGVRGNESPVPPGALSIYV
jgi:hypothetical protein